MFIATSYHDTIFLATHVGEPLSLSPSIRRRSGCFHAPGEPAGSAKIDLVASWGLKGEIARARANPASRPSSGLLCSQVDCLGGIGAEGGRSEQGEGFRKPSAN